jgi:hypothetical protein
MHNRTRRFNGDSIYQVMSLIVGPQHTHTILFTDVLCISGNGSKLQEMTPGLAYDRQ